MIEKPKYTACSFAMSKEDVQESSAIVDNAVRRSPFGLQITTLHEEAQLFEFRSCDSRESAPQQPSSFSDCNYLGGITSRTFY